MKKIPKYLTIFITTIIILFLFVMFFSEKEVRYQCTGKLTNNNDVIEPVEMFIKITEFRPWVSLWSDSNGYLNTEIPEKYKGSYYAGFYGHLEKTGDKFQIYDTYPEKIFRGYFSILSNTLFLDLESYFGIFEGKCNNIY